MAIVWALFTAKNAIAKQASVPGVGVNFIASLLVSVQIFIMDTLYVTAPLLLLHYSFTAAPPACCCAPAATTPARWIRC